MPSNLLTVMLCDYFIKNDIKSPDFDYKKVRDAVTSGNTWAIERLYPYLGVDELARRQLAEEIDRILSMWIDIESVLKTGSRNSPQFQNSSFMGFCFTSEGESLATARFLIENFNKFSIFRNRPLESYVPRMSTYRRMLKTYHLFMVNGNEPSLTMDDVKSIFQEN